ncbi:MAG: PadR family transcriptional regulator, partial [Gaiellaceae bacterium]
LQQLEDEGLVRWQEVEGRRVLELSDAGREVLASRPEGAAAPWEEMVGGVGDQALELHSLVRQIALAAMQVMQAGSEPEIEEARKILSGSRRALYRILAGDEAGGESTGESS